MSKKYVLLLGMLNFMSLGSYAQEDNKLINDDLISEKVEYPVDTKKFFKNWFVTGAVGGQVYFGDHDKQVKPFERIAPMGEFGVGKWFSPILGMRFMYQLGAQYGATKVFDQSVYPIAYATGKILPGKGFGTGYDLQRQKFGFGNLSFTALFNIMNLFNYVPERKFMLSPYAGVGFATTFDEPDEYQVKHGIKTGAPVTAHSPLEVTANVGVFAAYRINYYFDVNVDVRGMYTNDRFDGEGGGRFGEGNWSVSAGITYKFKKRGFAQDRIITRDYGNYGDAVIGPGGRIEINGLPVNTLKMSASDVLAMRERMDQLMAENARLESELAKGNNVVASETKLAAAANLIVFPINKTTLTNESRVHLYLMAEMIKVCDPDITYVISGYADKGTGNPQINERLSRGRAQAVYDCLVNEFGISPKQLRMEFHGGVPDMFYNDPRLSRVVINRAELRSKDAEGNAENQEPVKVQAEEQK